MAGDGEKGIVCVTGGTGYLASWMIMKLLQLGYSVTTTVRFDPDKKKDVSYLTSLPGASENLQILNADLAEPDSFDEAIRGCTGVLHVAHPVDFEGKEPEEVTTQIAVDGTIGILKACLRSKTVKRVVYTSTICAVLGTGKGEETVDESAWSDDVDFVRALYNRASSYAISKTLTERAAIGFAEQHGLDLVTVLPSMIFGPFIGPQCPGSAHLLLSMIYGDQTQYEHISYSPMVHIDDVARAHIFLLECPEAKGRYICSAEEWTIYQIAEFLSTKYPEYQIPKADFLKQFVGIKRPSLSSKKLLDAGFQYRYGIEQMYDEAIRCCKEKGLL